MRTPSRPMPARRSGGRLLLVALAIAVLLGAYPRRAAAQAKDYQSVPLGGVAAATNGIISSGTPGNNDDGICNDVTPLLVLGDDVLRILPGKSEPRQRGVRASISGPGAIESTPSGDDVLTAVICPGIDSVLQSIVAGDDQSFTSGRLCQVCGGSGACIIPGVNDVLDTTVDPADVLQPYISTSADGISQTTASGNDFQEIPVGQGSKDTICVDAGPNHIAETSLCGNGIVDFLENGPLPFGAALCDDGNIISGDGCSSTCIAERCGDGILQPLLGEECDDGNSNNSDACIVGCRNARCGDGFRERGVEQCEPPNTPTCDATCHTIVPPRCGDHVVDPGEQCDDGNNSDSDDCTNNCQVAVCGDGLVHTKGTPPFEECDDGNTTPGDGCSATCTRECGNGVIDGGCSQGLVHQACSTNDQCDTSLGAGDGVCVHEACDPGLANLCQPGPTMCSNFCQIAACGNGEVECDEECDLGPANGVPGSGCTATCTRNVVGKNEITSKNECPSAWTLDSAPDSLNLRKQICTDGDPCDHDSISGQCTFRVGVCLNRPGVPGCVRSSLRSFELQRLKVTIPQEAAAMQALTAAVHDLAPSAATVPDLCRKGARGKACTIPVDAQCDTFLGRGDGVCDIGSRVDFFPPLDPADLGGAQLSACTPGIDIVVNAGTILRLRSRATLNGGRNDRDALLLNCRVH